VERFEIWADNIHPRQLNFARKYGIDLDALTLTFRGYCLGTEKGLQVVDFGESFWRFLTSERAKLASEKARGQDYRKRQERWEQERRERFARAPGDIEHEQHRAEEQREKLARRSKIAELYPGLGKMMGGGGK
jgi:hypothetical protein